MIGPGSDKNRKICEVHLYLFSKSKSEKILASLSVHQGLEKRKTTSHCLKCENKNKTLYHVQDAVML